MNIAICDDNWRDLQSLKTLLLRSADNCSIDCFESGEALLAEAKNKRYDLAFLDICLNGEDGLQVAKRLIDGMPGTKVVFTTVSDAYAVEAFSLDALHYLVKPVTQENVVEALRRREHLRAESAPINMLTVRIGNDIYTLRQPDIVRVESNNHKTVIYMLGGNVYSIWMHFNKIETLLDDQFLTIKRGVCVNMRHVARWGTQECMMVDGTTYLISRGKLQQARDLYFAFKARDLERQNAARRRNKM